MVGIFVITVSLNNEPRDCRYLYRFCMHPLLCKIKFKFTIPETRITLANEHFFLFKFLKSGCILDSMAHYTCINTVYLHTFTYYVSVHCEWIPQMAESHGVENAWPPEWETPKVPTSTLQKLWVPHLCGVTPIKSNLSVKWDMWWCHGCEKSAIVGVNVQWRLNVM